MYCAMACFSLFALWVYGVGGGGMSACDGLLVRRKILRLYWLAPLWLFREGCLFKLLMVARETQNLASLLAGAAVMMGWGWRGEMRRGGRVQFGGISLLVKTCTPLFVKIWILVCVFLVYTLYQKLCRILKWIFKN